MRTTLTRRRFGVSTIALLVSALPTLAACPRMPGDVPTVQPGAYGDTPAELQRLWTEALAAAKRDDRMVLRALLSSMILTPEELTTLLGPARAERLGPRYKALATKFVGPAAAELVGFVYERRYDDVAVTRIDTLAPPARSEDDNAVLSVLARPIPLYTVRIKHKAQTLGLRYDFFVYLNGRWRTGYLLGQYIPDVLAEEAQNQAPAAKSAH